MNALQTPTTPSGWQRARRTLAAWLLSAVALQPVQAQEPSLVRKPLVRAAVLAVDDGAGQ
mgnify:CR=1 FL=1